MHASFYFDCVILGGGGGGGTTGRRRICICMGTGVDTSTGERCTIFLPVVLEPDSAVFALRPLRSIVRYSCCVAGVELPQGRAGAMGRRKCSVCPGIRFGDQ